MVRKNQRSTSRFETLDKALELVTYTTNIIDNDKIFDKKHQRTIDRISEEVTMIYHFCRVANNIRVNDYKAETEKVIQRIKLESEALELCEALLTDIMISHKLFHLKASRVRYWTKMTVDTKEMITKWRESEKKRC